jgi:hypothetical protein
MAGTFSAIAGAARRVSPRLVQVLLVLMVAAVAPLLPAGPAQATGGDFRLRCSELSPGTTVDCYAYQTEPEQPWVRVTLRSKQPAEETLLLDDPRPQWEDHEVWFSFELPGTAQPGDEVLVMLRNGADEQAGDFVLPVAGSEPAEPGSSPSEPEPIEEPTTQAPDVEPSGPAQGPDVDAIEEGDTSTDETSASELPHTGSIVPPLVLFASGALVAGRVLLVRARPTP